MTNQKFREIRNNVTELDVIKMGFSDRVVAVEIDNVRYSRSKSEGHLTAKQLDYFKYLPNLYNDKPINI